MYRFLLFFISIIFSMTGLSKDIIQQDTPNLYHQHSISTVDLNTYPELINSSMPVGTEITIGDLHGNAQKLMYFLIKNNVVDITKQDYAEFVRIYKTPVDLLTKQDIKSFDHLINNLDFNNRYKLRFLGDDLSDRGMNDYYILKIFQAMDLAFVKFEITLSNHNKFFLEAYERVEQSFDYNPYGPGRYEDIVRSMLNLGKLISRGLASRQEVLKIVETHYLKHLVLPGITVNKAKKEITIYTHAPVDLNIIKNLALSLGIDYKDATLEDLITSINQINSKIQSWIKQKSFIANYDDMYAEYKNLQQPCALHQVLWNRNYSILNNDNFIENRPYTVNYVHGHDSKPNMVNLDNYFGKGDDDDHGQYAVYITST